MPRRSDPRPVLYERRMPRWPHAVALLGALLLTSVAIRILFFGLGEIESPVETADWGKAAIFGAVGLVCVFLSGVFAYRLVRNPPTLVLFEDGFEYTPAGVSTGLIKWSDVLELRDETLVVNVTNARNNRRVTAVVLRDPEEYMSRFPAALRPVFAANLNLNSSPILITPGEFGDDHDAIIAIMRENIAKPREAKR